MFSDPAKSAPFDLAVVGAGPAAQAVAARGAERGLRVVMVAPNHERSWLPRFGMWASELPQRYRGTIGHAWSETRVVLDGNGEDERLLPHSYVALDTKRLQQQMSTECDDAGVERAIGHVVALEHDRDGSRLICSNGSRLATRVVVDASGSSSGLVRRTDRRPPAFQTAFGQLLRVTDHALNLDQMTLMDFSGFPQSEAATFLYAQPLGEDLVFVEETSLVSRPGLSRELLKQRLTMRLKRMGIQPLEFLDEEECTIAMGTALPRRNQRCIAYGAAGSFVHPATGYQLARALGEAESLVDGVCRGLDQGGPTRASRLAYAAIWPTARLRSWELYTFGMNVLCGLDAGQTRQFMQTFFALPEHYWLGFLQATLAPKGVAQAMFHLFGTASSELRSRLFRFGAGAGLPTLIRAVTPRISL